MQHWFARVAMMLMLATAAPCLAAFDSATQPTSGPLQIIRVTPEGEDVSNTRQIVIQFNRAVVPVGKMERAASEIPVIITPAVSCEWRWLNNSALACNLPETAPLQASTHYTMEIKPGITAEDGATISDTYTHKFTTERPAVTYKQFRFWKSAGYPIIRLSFNQPVDKDSLAEHLLLTVGDEGEQVNVHVKPDPEDRTPPQFMPVPSEKKIAVFAAARPQHSDDQLQQKNGKEARRVWLVEPVRELPLDSSVVLSASEGIRSALGDAVGQADKTIVKFDTYPEFRFLGVACTSINNTAISLVAGTESSDKCDPMSPISLRFSAPVTRSMLAKTARFTPPITSWGGDEEEADAALAVDENTPEGKLGYEYRRPHEKDRTYNLWLPQGLKAASSYSLHSAASEMSWFARAWHWFKNLFVHSAPLAVEDIFGRSLANGFALNFATDHRKPNYELNYDEAVLESQIDSEVPLYVNNLQSYQFSYRRFTTKGLSENETFTQPVPQVQDVQFAVPLGVRDMLQGKSGALYGFLSTTPAVAQYEPSKLFAQVTPYQVHVKLGHFTSLVWVTDMATGETVPDANVGIYVESFPSLGSAKKPLATATTDALGTATLPGTETLDPELKLSRVYDIKEPRLFVRVSKSDNLAIVPISGGFELNNYRTVGNEWFYPSERERYGHVQAWGTTAQGIYRASDTIQYKLFVRNQDNRTLTPAPKTGYRLKIIDPMGKVVHTVDEVKLSSFGGYDGSFTVPEEGAVGWYQFKLIADYAQRNGHEDAAEEEVDAGADGRMNEEADERDSGTFWIPLRVMVSDFTPAPFKVTGQINGDRFTAEQDITATTRAELHSGGAYTDASARITATLDSRNFTSKDPLASDFYFASYPEEANYQQIFQEEKTIDDKGERVTSFSTGKPNIVFGKLTVESAVADDRGKFVTGFATADYVGVDRLVGLRSKQWVFPTGKAAAVDYIIVDDSGKPVAGTKVAITVEREATKAARVKGAGNAYLNEYHTEWEAAGNCDATAGAEGGSCSFTPSKAGSYRIVAKIKDTKGRDHSTTLNTYVTGSDYVLWNDETDTSLEVIPQAKEYKVGDTARFLVKNPYPGAKALITVERYGVIDRFVQTFDGSTPIVEVPITPDHIPGIYVSVIVTSPRVEKPLGEGQVDLGKPAFRMGYAKLTIDDPYKQVTVTATTDKPVYKPREKVTVKLHAQPTKPSKPEPIELTVTVLDEAVFDLIGSGIKHFDPYAGFYTLASLDLRNYSLLQRLIGRQKFEKKGANPGGDGGADLSMRSLFKFVSYWNGALTTDAKGNATIQFEAPDNLTGWRVLAMAATPSDRFGLGQANFKVNRPTELRPVMPNQVTEGDRFDAGFSVMNRTDKERTLTVAIRAEGDISGKNAAPSISKKITLAPYKREVVTLPITTRALPVSREQKTGEVRFIATAGDAADEDGLTHSVPVLKSRALEVAATYGTTTEDKTDTSIAFPASMLPDVGSLSVVASPTVIGNLAGAFTYMRDYPYQCWEQRLSKAVMASHHKNLHAYLPASLAWADSDTLAQTTLDSAASFQAPNGGMTYFRAEDAYVDPYLSAYTALAFQWLRASGYRIPETVEVNLHTYLNNLLKNDAMPDFYSEGMSSDVRAVALAALAKSGKVALSDIERYAPHLAKMSLFGRTHFMQAAMGVKGAEQYTTDAAKRILASANQTGGKFVFSETLDDSYSRILASPLRENCAVLSAFTAYGETPKGAELVGDVPFKLVRFITQSRGARTHFENTQENIFCMNALTEFARMYEKDVPNMTVSAALNGTRFGSAKFESVKDEAATLERPHSAGDAGSKATLTVQREGTGRVYFATRLAYALPASETKPANAGIEITREYSVERDGAWIVLKDSDRVKRGEVVRVDLFVSVPAARNFVVVDDAIPGGLEPVNRDLATASAVDAKKAEFRAAGGSYWFKYSDWSEFAVSRWSFYHQELRHDAARFYADYLPAGNYHLSYAAQAIATGSFSARPAKAEEMYDPDVFGTSKAMALSIDEAAPKP